MKSIRIILADDHPIVLFGVREILEKDGSFDIVAEVSDGKDLVEKAEELFPQLILTDIGLPNINGLDVVERLKKSCPNTRCIVMTMHHDVAYVKQALKLEVAGFVSKRESFSHLPQTLKSVAQGHTYYSPSLSNLFSQILKSEGQSIFDSLTRKERQVLQCLATGNPETEMIAKQMKISSATVRKHLQNIMDKLDIHKRWDLIQFAKEKGFSTD